MAGYTSRIFLSLTIPSFFGFLSVLWFLKRKRSITERSNKAIQVEDNTVSSEVDQYQFLNPMKLKNQEGIPEEENISCSEMQLKEAPTAPEKQSQHSNGVSSQHHSKVKGKKKSKSKVRENGSICLSGEHITNGCGKDISPLTAEDSTLKLTNGIQALSLIEGVSDKDEVVVHVTDKAASKMENSNGLSVFPNGAEKDSDSCVKSSTLMTSSNGEVEKDSQTNDDKSSCQENCIQSVKEQNDKDAMQNSVETNSLTIEQQVVQSDLGNDTSPAENMPTNTSEPLMLPVDCPAVEIQGDMLESPGAKYCDSVGSNDSGKGGSEFQFVLEPQQIYVVYEFEILQELCGLLIGRNGRHVNYIKQETNANILIKRHPYFTEKKVCSVTGTQDEIDAALKLIRKRFPVELYPSVTLAQINVIPFEFQLPQGWK
ncbi:A-kinase anchor protein 1, mitochondrial, partial [Stegodyphus mimosarum]